MQMFRKYVLWVLVFSKYVGHLELTVYNTVLLDLWWNMLAKFSKQIANTFVKIINGYKCKFKTLSNIWAFPVAGPGDDVKIQSLL